MRKFSLLFSFLLFSHLFLFAHENRANFVLSGYMDERNSSSDKVYDYILAGFSYEFLTKPFENTFCNFSVETAVNLNPLINVYSLSINVKGYMHEDFTGLFFGLSPLSECNLGNLFLKNPYINYAIGFITGYNQAINTQLDFETKGELVFSIYDKLTKTKLKVSVGLGLYF